MKPCELGGWEWRQGCEDAGLVDVALQRCSVGCWAVVPAWDFWGVLGVRVLVLLFTWCCCTGLPPAARQSTASRGKIPTKTLQAQGFGTVLSAVTWGPPRTGRFTGTGAFSLHWSRSGCGRLAFPLLPPFTSLFLFLPWGCCPRHLLPLPSPESQNQKWDLDRTVLC